MTATPSEAKKVLRDLENFTWGIEDVLRRTLKRTVGHRRMVQDKWDARRSHRAARKAINQNPGIEI